MTKVIYQQKFSPQAGGKILVKYWYFTGKKYLGKKPTVFYPTLQVSEVFARVVSSCDLDPGETLLYSKVTTVLTVPF